MLERMATLDSIETEITETVRRLIAAICHPLPLPADVQPLDALGGRFDAIGRMTLACDIETHFGVLLKDETVETMKIIGDVIAAVLLAIGERDNDLSSQGE